MFGPKLQNSYLYRFENSETLDLEVPEVRVPIPSEKDLKWKKDVNAALRSNNLSKIRGHLEKASDQGCVWRVWYLLNVDHKLPDDSKIISNINFNFVTNAYSFSDSIDVLTLFSMQLPLKPEQFSSAYSKKSKFLKLPMSVYYTWLEACGEAVAPYLVEAFVRKGTIEDLSELKDKYGVKFSKGVLEKIIKTCVDCKDISYLESLFELDVDPSCISLATVDYASVNNRRDISQFLKSRMIDERSVEETETMDKWCLVNASVIYKDELLPLEEGRVRHLFDFNARRYTAVMTENPSGASTVLFSENMRDIEGQSRIEEAATALNDLGGNAGDYKKTSTAPVALKTATKQSV
jgi:hypothetical protein